LKIGASAVPLACRVCAATQDHPYGHGCRSSRVRWLRLKRLGKVFGSVT
jgi:hypothetical protein